MGCVASKHVDSTPAIVSRRTTAASPSRSPPSYSDVDNSNNDIRYSDKALRELPYEVEYNPPHLSEPVEINSSKAELSPDRVKFFSENFNADPKNRFAQNVATRGDITTLLVNRDAMIADNSFVFNTRIPTELPVTNQKSSGRCWIFAGLNVLRLEVMKKYNLDQFELSQSYLHAMDQLEKSNWFLECMIDLKDTAIEDRVVQYLLQQPIQDGGQFEMFVNLVEKYGVLPKDQFPETFSSSSTGKLHNLMISKLRDYTVVLRRMAAQGCSVKELRAQKSIMMEEIYRILAITLGEPPKKFNWAFYNKDKKYYSFENLTAKSFFKNHVQYPIAETLSIIHDPRNEPLQLYTVQYLGNIAGGRPIRYVNAEIGALKDLAIKKIKTGKPVWFGADVGKFANGEKGILDPALFNYDLAFNVTFDMTKAERLVYGESLMTHAMVFTGVHLDPTTGAPVRWRVENSWGTDSGEHSGYWMMSDAWFDQWVYQIVIEKEIAPKKYLQVLDQEVRVLPAYDPMGALARMI